MIQLGETARELRQTLGLSQLEAAEDLGISNVHLCNIEKNKSRPSPDLLRRYREVWNVDLYVMAWCQHGDVKQLPKSLRSAARQLSSAWNEEIDRVVSKRRRSGNQ